MAINLSKIDVESFRTKIKRYNLTGENSLRQFGYSIGTYEYPTGLRVKPDLQHYVAFKINVREKSEVFNTSNSNEYFDRAPDSRQNRTRSNLPSEDFRAAGNVLLNNAIVLGGLAGVVAGKGLGGKILGGLTGGGVAGVISNYIKKLPEPIDYGKTKRLKEVITLHIEDRPSTQYQVNYTDRDLGTLTGLIVQGSALQLAGKLDSDAFNEAGVRVLSELIKLPSLGQGGSTLSNIRELATRAKTNPFREVLFETVNYRTFNFRYRFFPKSVDESNKIRNIIKLFKLHMHPELSKTKFFHIYPSEFEIEYYYRDRKNDYLHEFATCALTNMQVEYGGDQFATFDNGAPVEIYVTLTFQELEQLTSGTIDKYDY
jgi:hypothetical protein